MKQPIIIGSRGSDLALWQANFIQEQLRECGVQSEIKIIKTQGDKIQHLSFDKMEGKGFFTKEIEAALLAEEVDLAVHSHKDLETTPPEGLVIAAVSDRANPNEYLLIRREEVDPLQPLKVKPNAVIGTSAARRKGQLLSVRSDIQIKDLRGNVPTRINKLREGQYDAILVARAGVDRLDIDLSEFVVEELDPRVFVPAPAQGVLGFQVRETDHELKQLLQEKINHPDVAETIACERGVLRLVDGGCQVPYGGMCSIEEDRLLFWSFYARKDGSNARRLYLDIPKNAFNAATVLEKLQEPRKGKVLVTREMKRSGFAKEMLLDAGVDLTEKSFIDIRPVEPAPVDLSSFSWVFFTSPNAVKHFPHYDKLATDVKWAAVGRGTYEALNVRGVDADFIGMGTTPEVGQVFRAELGNQNALVVCGKNGLRNIQKSLPSNQFSECEVYTTTESGHQVADHFDVIAFTSPSNVRAYLAHNEWNSNSKAVSIGQSTAAALEAAGISPTISWESSEQALADTIMGLV